MRCPALPCPAAAAAAAHVQVRYSTAVSGLQRVQSRGRARREGAHYLSLLTTASLDARMHSKSSKQEANMTAVLRALADAAPGRMA